MKKQTTTKKPLLLSVDSVRHLDGGVLQQVSGGHEKKKQCNPTYGI